MKLDHNIINSIMHYARRLTPKPELLFQQNEKGQVECSVYPKPDPTAPLTSLLRVTKFPVQERNIIR